MFSGGGATGRHVSTKGFSSSVGSIGRMGSVFSAAEFNLGNFEA